MGKYTSEDITDLAHAMRKAASQGRPFAVLSGAGISKTAGIPLAKDLVKLINDQYSYRLRGLSDVQRGDYGACMARLAPADRKTLLDPFLNKPNINWAHIALACLIKAGFIGRVLTFNFDSILVRACGLVGLYPAIYDFGIYDLGAEDAQKNLDLLVTPSIIHLHGQGSGLRMLNSTNETAAHAQKLAPLFAHTFYNSSVLTLGYSGAADGAFDAIKNGFGRDCYLYWTDIELEETAPSKAIRTRALDTTHYLGGADADYFLVHLAQELKCFPPSILTKHQQHLLDELEPIVEPPAELLGLTGNILAGKRKKLEEELQNTPQLLDILNKLMLEGRYQQVIDKQAEATTAEEKDIIAWAYFMQGNTSSERAQTKQGAEADALFREAFAKYAAAFDIKPDKHEALNNWGLALANLAKTKQGVEAESLYHEAFAKYAAALDIKPDKHEALNNWGLALSQLAQTKQGAEAESLYHEAFAKYAAALDIKPDKHEALYNWGNASSQMAQTKQGAEAEALWCKAFDKYAAALAIKPESHEALNNWGIALSALAQTKQGAEAESLYHEAFAKYAAALNIKPNYHEAPYNWGLALANLAKTKQGAEAESLYHEAFAKYATALDIKPDMHEALNNWGGALSGLYHLTHNADLLSQMLDKATQAKAITKQPEYNLACAYALNGRPLDCRDELLACQAAGTLPTAAHMQEDRDLEPVWNADWFIALTSEA